MICEALSVRHKGKDQWYPSGLLFEPVILQTPHVSRSKQPSHHPMDTPWLYVHLPSSRLCPQTRKATTSEGCSLLSKSEKEREKALWKYPLKHLVNTVFSLNMLLSPSHCSLKWNIEKCVLCCNCGAGRKQTWKMLIFRESQLLKKPWAYIHRHHPRAKYLQSHSEL